MTFVILLLVEGGSRGCVRVILSFLLRVQWNWMELRPAALAERSVDVVIVRILAREGGWPWIQ